MTRRAWSWSPPSDEVGPGEQYDPCPRALCDGWGHRLDRTHRPVILVRTGPEPTLQTGHVVDALYRCEECGEEWTHPIATVLHQEVLPL